MMHCTWQRLCRFSAAGKNSLTTGPETTWLSRCEDTASVPAQDGFPRARDLLPSDSARGSNSVLWYPIGGGVVNHRFGRMRSLFAAIMLVSGLFAGSASADDFPSTPPAYAAPLSPAWVWEFGGRYWYSSGKNWYNYYGDNTTSLLVSRRTYQGMTGQSGEAFFRVDSVSGSLSAGGETPAGPTTRNTMRRIPGRGLTETATSGER